jgi:hypothetical protein
MIAAFNALLSQIKTKGSLILLPGTESYTEGLVALAVIGLLALLKTIWDRMFVGSEDVVDFVLEGEEQGGLLGRLLGDSDKDKDKDKGDGYKSYFATTQKRPMLFRFVKNFMWGWVVYVVFAALLLGAGGNMMRTIGIQMPAKASTSYKPYYTTYRPYTSSYEPSYRTSYAETKPSCYTLKKG